MNVLFSCLFGSALYGTRTPTSDRDEKYVYLPSLDNLLLGKKLINKNIKTNTQKNVRNSVDDVDKEYIPIQVFANDFMMGQTYALEMAFAIEGNHAEQKIFDPRGEVVDRPRTGLMVRIRDVNFEEWEYETPYFIQFVQELRERFLTSNIKAMMGYVVNQASLYSFKGERLNVAQEVAALLLEYSPENRKHEGDAIEKVYETESFRRRAENIALKYPKYFKKDEYDIGGGRMKPCFVLLEKTLPFTMKIGHAHGVVQAIVERYGSRAAAASDTNVDWKATMHALRIVDEGLNLLEHRTLSFPFDQEYVNKLLSIKRGEVELAPVTQELTEKLDRLKELEKTTSLPAFSQEMQIDFETWLAGWMRKFYNLK